MAPGIAKLHENGLLIAKRIASSVERMQKGLPFVDPLQITNPAQQEKAAKKLGLTWQGNNLVNLRTGK
jgi:hypothetical protein